jgi:hypothetical protein
MLLFVSTNLSRVVSAWLFEKFTHDGSNKREEHHLYSSVEYLITQDLIWFILY